MMKSIALFLLCTSIAYSSCQAQSGSGASDDMTTAASRFLESLTTKQRSVAQFSFDNEERFNWHFIPRSRKGIPMGDLNEQQRKAALALMHSALSDTGYTKATSIFQLENVLREVENRPASDDYRNPDNYYISLFGNPATDSVWGWRLEGHHVSFNFSSDHHRIISGTPGFLGANPAIVLSGPEAGKQVLKDETDLGFALLQSLDASQLEKTMIRDRAPYDIVTGASRKAMIDEPRGILYSELNSSQQKIFLQLLSLYIQRYTKLFAADMMKEIETAGLEKLRFAWAGKQQKGPGNPHYYRIQGPTLIIEYDNTQNNANHVHTVVRDLNHDFGGDELLEHYRQTAH